MDDPDVPKKQVSDEDDGFIKIDLGKAGGGSDWAGGKGRQGLVRVTVSLAGT